MSRPIWYDSAETGAPTLNNAAGSLLEVLRACLINGFNLKSVTSIVVASGVATATSATHGYSAAYGKLLRIEGAPVAGLNGDVQPLTVDTNTFTYAAAGVPDGTYTGTITARRAPLGWTEAFTGTNTAIFARTSPEAGTQMLRVLDTAASPALTTDARVLMIESATDIDTFTNQAPNSTQMTDGAGGYWAKGFNASTAKPWAIVGTERGFYYFGPTQVSTQTEKTRLPFWFGDGVRAFPGDEHFCLLGANSVGNTGNSTSKIGTSLQLSFAWTTTGAQSAVVARSRHGDVVSQVFTTYGATVGVFGLLTDMPAGMPEKMVMIGPVLVSSDLSSKEIRGALPGVMTPIANAPFTGLGAWSVLPASEIDGRVYLAVQSKANGFNDANYCVDLTGPWYE